MSTKLIIAGEGGQGIQTIAKALTETAVKQNYNCQYIPSFGVEQRGTPSIAFLTISKKTLFYPRFHQADIAVILQKRAVSAVSEYITPNTKVIFDSSTVPASSMPKQAIHIFGLPATKIATDNFSPKSFNMIITGALCSELKLDPKIVWQSIENTLGKKFKTAEIKQKNKEAFEFGVDASYEISRFSQAVFKPKTGINIQKDNRKTAIIVPTRCKGCGICIKVCPVKALSFGEDLGVFATPVPEINLEKCIACGKCTQFCPDAAIKVSKNS